ncbi:hypothetical protein [Micromonospora sp. HM5-17]|uniref:hypothetical protein n=1 Tax=Micromonospora sp. HM5-17 TaxID=2487710 RepID=UPI000F4AE31F|nr:hypothetical protein [Micromonospora sp. HM5-17]ROT33520.1 hypothetical protein EF879_00695 [Micromonospora sp. HM5-17]
MFDNVSLAGDAPDGEWSHGGVGELGRTDWERYHRAPGFVESGGTYTITGSGDIGPLGTEGGYAPKDALVGLAVGLGIVLPVAVRFAADRRRADQADATPADLRLLTVRAGVTGAVAFLAGLVAAGVAVPAGLRAAGGSVPAVPVPTQLRLVVGVAVLFAGSAVLAVALGTLARRTWVAVLGALTTVVLPYVVAALPLLPDGVADWLLTATPAAGFAVQQTIQEYPQMVAHYAPSAGYFPLPWWAGLLVLGGYAVVGIGLAVRRLRRWPSEQQPGAGVDRGAGAAVPGPLHRSVAIRGPRRRGLTEPPPHPLPYGR